MRPSITESQYVIKKARHKSVDGYELSLSSTGSVFVRFNQVSSGNTYKLLSTSGYPDDANTWIHLAATYDGQEIKLYLDGFLDSSMFAPGLSIGSNNNSLSIGAQDDGYRPFEGAVDNVHLYNFALSQTEIQELFEAESEVDPNEEPLDSDGDGMPDNWELLWGFDPFDATDAAEDADGDGVSNLDEYLQGTNPADDPLEEVGNWPFDEGSGTSVADISGFNNHGFFVGSLTWTTNSYGSALYFHEDESRVVIPDSPSLDITEAITIAAWMRPSITETQYVIKKARHKSVDGYELSLSSRGSVFVRFNQFSFGNTYKLLSTGGYPGDGMTWMHAAATYDGQEIRLYLNGLLDSSMFAPGLSIGSNNNSLSIGAQDDGYRPFEGTVDNVHLYNFALSQMEIQNLVEEEVMKLVEADIPGLDPLTLTLLDPIPTTTSTAEKPQSKVWFYDEMWWAVFPDDSGAWIWRLDGNTWAKTLHLSPDPNVHADCDLIEDDGVVHILLFNGSDTQLVSVEYLPTSPGTYQFWSQGAGVVDVPLENTTTKTATIAIDSTERMWVAYDDPILGQVKVRYSDSSSGYSLWSDFIIVAEGVDSGTISAIVAFDSKIGVMWSNEVMERFGFRFHLDGDSPIVWSADEVPASQSALNVGAGMADDHINIASTSDGTLYVAIKTGYDSVDLPSIALLVRRPWGVWDDLYEVDLEGSRPIVLVSETLGKVVVVYSESDSGGAVRCRISNMSNISFGLPRNLMFSFSQQNVSSIKHTFDDEFVVISTKGTDDIKVMGVLCVLE
jgi:hypothetical protein